MKKEIKWSIDQAHSQISFKVRHLMISHVNGKFKSFDASIYTTGKDFSTAEIDLWIDVESISTGDATRDEHLKGEDFFDIKKHKQITFTASGIEKAKMDGQREIWGTLTINGIGKKIKLEVEFGGIVKDPWGKEKAGFRVVGAINRSDWGLTWNTAIEAGGLVVSDEVKILCEFELTNIGDKDLLMELETAEQQSH